VYDHWLFIESPVQITVVLVIALIVFGPKRLPEIGRQIGSALRELRKAANDVARSFSTEHEPDTTSYPYTSPPSSYMPADTYYTPPSIEQPLDLTDYTIAGMAPPEPAPPPFTPELEALPGAGGDSSADASRQDLDPGATPEAPPAVPGDPGGEAVGPAAGQRGAGA